VYHLLPGLRPPLAAILPESFISELEAARRAQDLGHLRLLSQEARSFHWRAGAVKEVGNAQFLARDLSGARETFEYLLSIDPQDTDANLRLGTVYQRLKEPRRSDKAIKRALELLEPASKHRAHAFALLGRNAKAGWLEAWRSRPRPEWRAEALRCQDLKDAYQYYLTAFKQDLNNYYGGLNALALGTIAIELAGALPEVWTGSFEDNTEADFACRH
jgi:tetratricopeptide (TPR) repeat protein